MKLLRAGEQQLVRTNRELDRLSNLRRDFLQLALHNLRSPIGAVGMYLSNLQGGYGGVLGAEQAEWVARSQRRLAELMAFLHDLEFLTVLESDGFKKHASTVDLESVLRELVEENRDLARMHRHLLILEPAGGMPRIRGIPRLVREAVVNFLINAIKYTPDGGSIVVRALPRGDFVRVEVQDNGIGIKPEDQARLFQQFVRLPRTKSESVETPGSGLGLYIVRRIAEAHGGRVELISEVDKGSSFAIEFPRAGGGSLECPSPVPHQSFISLTET